MAHRLNTYMILFLYPVQDYTCALYAGFSAFKFVKDHIGFDVNAQEMLNVMHLYNYIILQSFVF